MTISTNSKYVRSGKSKYSKQNRVGVLGQRYSVISDAVADIIYDRGSNAHMYLPGAQTPVLGPELVTNGSFDTDTGWTKQAGWSISGGSANVDSSAAGTTNISQNAVLEIGKSYLVSYTIKSVSGAGIRAFVGGVWDNASYRTSPGYYATPIVVTASSGAALAASGTNTIGSVDGFSVREILSYNDVISGFHTGNYVESTGVTPATVDQPVGLVLDAAGSVGSDLTPTGTSWIAANCTKSGDNYPITLTGTAAANQYIQAANKLVIGKVYRITVEWSGNVNNRNVLINGTGIPQLATPGVDGTEEIIITATDTTTYVGFLGGVIGEKFTIVSLKTQEVTGIHASQSTSGFRPVERRGIVNLLTYSNDLTNAAWQKLNITIASATGYAGAQTAVTTTVTASASATLLVKASGNYTSAKSGSITAAWMLKIGSGSGNRALLVRNHTTATSFDGGVINIGTGVVTGPGFAGYDAGNGWALVTYTRSTGITAGDLLINYCGYTGNSTVTAGDTMTVDGMAIFDGTLTAAQILAMGGIPLTTTAAASSALGPYYLQFDGTDDRLVTGVAPFTIGDDFCVVISAKLAPNATTRYLFNMGAGAGGQMVGAVYTTAAGNIGARWADDAATAHSIASATSFAEQTVVISTISRSGTRSLKVNGVQVGSSSSALGTATVSAACIGDWKSGGGNYFNGNIYACIPIKGTLSDAEITLLEKQAAQLAGVTL